MKSPIVAAARNDRVSRRNLETHDFAPIERNPSFGRRPGNRPLPIGSTGLLTRPDWRPLGESLWSIINKIVVINQLNQEEFKRLFYTAGSCYRRRSFAKRQLWHSDLIAALSHFSVKDLLLSTAYPYIADHFCRRIDADHIEVHLFRRFRYCTICIEMGVHTVIHQLRSLAHCPWHDMPQVDACPGCRRPFNFLRTNDFPYYGFRCPCGHSIVKSKNRDRIFEGLSARQMADLRKFRRWIERIESTCSPALMPSDTLPSAAAEIDQYAYLRLPGAIAMPAPETFRIDPIDVRRVATWTPDVQSRFRIRLNAIRNASKSQHYSGERDCGLADDFPDVARHAINRVRGFIQSIYLRPHHRCASCIQWTIDQDSPHYGLQCRPRGCIWQSAFDWWSAIALNYFAHLNIQRSAISVERESKGYSVADRWISLASLHLSQNESQWIHKQLLATWLFERALTAELVDAYVSSLSLVAAGRRSGIIEESRARHVFYNRPTILIFRRNDLRLYRISARPVLRGLRVIAQSTSYRRHFGRRLTEEAMRKIDVSNSPNFSCLRRC